MDTPAKDSIKIEPYLDLHQTVSRLDRDPHQKIDEIELDVDVDAVETYPPPWKRWVILIDLSFAQAIDVMSSSALFVILTPTARDLNIAGGDISWILTSYIITFAAFQLSAGRLADLTSPGWVFIIGIAGVAVFNLVLSFISNGLLFIVLRALQGIMAALTVPSAYTVTIRTFPPGKERRRALAILGMVGAISFTLGTVVGGLFEEVSWRWLFRTMAIVTFLVAGIGFLLIDKSRIVTNISLKTVLRRTDPIGLILSAGGVILLVLALTSGPEHGFDRPMFYVPLPVAVVLLVGFFVWEGKWAKGEDAMLPPGIWKIPTVKPLTFLYLCPFIYWSTSSFAYPTYWQQILGRTAIDAAVRSIPGGVSALLLSIVIHFKPGILSWRKWQIFATLSIAAAMEIVFIYSKGGAGDAYWKYCVPSFIIGSACCQLGFLSINVFILTTVPPSQAGVVGGLLSVVVQLGNALGLAIQAACLGVHDGPIMWEDYTRGFWAIFGWMAGSVVITGGVFILESRKQQRKVVASTADTSIIA